jgi:hypothetical protein
VLRRGVRLGCEGGASFAGLLSAACDERVLRLGVRRWDGEDMVSQVSKIDTQLMNRTLSKMSCLAEPGWGAEIVVGGGEKLGECGHASAGTKVSIYFSQARHDKTRLEERHAPVRVK